MNRSIRRRCDSAAPELPPDSNSSDSPPGRYKHADPEEYKPDRFNNRSARPKTGLVHVFHSGGHRATYQRFLASRLGLKPVTGPIEWSSWFRLLRAESLLFATVSGGTALKAMIIAFLRACRGRRTCAICMEEKWYLDRNRRLRSAISLSLFKLLNEVNRLTVYSVIPHQLMPELGRTTSGWILDLCLWDLHDSPEPDSVDANNILQRVREAAAGREVVLFLGKASRRKGYDELASLAKGIVDRALIVSAGRVARECRRAAGSLRDAGMFVEDRVVSDDELMSLYKAADYVWCRYDEASDSLSSGVFGRAVQLQKPTVVRPGSYLDRLAQLLDHPAVHDLEAELAARAGTVGRRTGADNAAADSRYNPMLAAMAATSIERLRSSL